MRMCVLELSPLYRKWKYSGDDDDGRSGDGKERSTDITARSFRDRPKKRRADRSRERAIRKKAVVWICWEDDERQAGCWDEGKRAEQVDINRKRPRQEMSALADEERDWAKRYEKSWEDYWVRRWVTGWGWRECDFLPLISLHYDPLIDINSGTFQRWTVLMYLHANTTAVMGECHENMPTSHNRIIFNNPLRSYVHTTGCPLGEEKCIMNTPNYISAFLL